MNTQLRANLRSTEDVLMMLADLGEDPDMKRVEAVREELRNGDGRTSPDIGTVRAAVDEARKRLDLSRDVVRVREMHGISDGMRVVVQDVEASPPQTHFGTVSSVWSDGSAKIAWDIETILSRDKHLVDNLRVDLHHVRKVGKDQSVVLDSMEPEML